MSLRHVLVCASIGAMLAACSLAEIKGDGAKPSDTSGGSSAAQVDGAPAACVADDSGFLKPDDPNKYPKCACAAKGGSARCVPKGNIPDVVSKRLDTCDQGLCLPDTIVKSGDAPLTKCNSSLGEGRCLSLCVRDVAAQADVLERGEGNVCADDERCVPCYDALHDNAVTGVCDIGKKPPTCTDASGQPTTPDAPKPTPITCPYNGPALVDVSKLEACGDGMRCVSTSLVPDSQIPLLKTCDKGVCAPEKSIAAGGQYLPKTCTALMGAEGRCLNVNIPAVEQQKAQLTRDVCDANELCASCFNPVDGKPTGACSSVSCDAPKNTTPKTFAPCCVKKGNSRAKCVPSSIVPVAQRQNLDNDSCKQNGELCVPNEMLQPNFKGPQCRGNTFFTGDYNGVCLSDCLSFGFIESLGIDRGNCSGGYKCVPCENDGKPTNAPGCPGT